MATAQRTNALVVDGDTVARAGMIKLLLETGQWTKCAEADTAGAALALAIKHRPGLIVLDLERIRGDGLALLHDLRAQMPQTPVAIVTHARDRQSVTRAFANGARGYALKTEAQPIVLAMLASVAAGRLSASPAVQTIALEVLSLNGHTTNPGANEPEDRLTDRELAVYLRVGRGLSTQEIADELHLSKKTVETHYTEIYKRLKLSGINAMRQSAALYVQEAD